MFDLMTLPLLAVLAQAAPMAQFPVMPPHPKDMVAISCSETACWKTTGDGKNREAVTIPEWNLWSRAFGFMAGRPAGNGKMFPTELPRDVLIAPDGQQQFTKEEVTKLKRLAEANVKNEQELKAETLKLRDVVEKLFAECNNDMDCVKQKGRWIKPKMRELELASRERTLEYKAKALEALQDNPIAQIAFTNWVESNKSGAEFGGTKSEYGHYRLPR